MLIIKTDKMNENVAALTLSATKSQTSAAPPLSYKYNNTNKKEILAKAKSSLVSSSKLSKDLYPNNVDANPHSLIE